MPIFHEGEPVSKEHIVGFDMPTTSTAEFAQQYKDASADEKKAILDQMVISPGDISQFASSPDYRAYRGVNQNLYETDAEYRNKVNELITAQTD